MGYDADLTVWDPEGSFQVTKDIIEFKNKITPYEGLHLNGIVLQTYVCGYKVYDKGLFNELSKGKVMLRR